MIPTETERHWPETEIWLQQWPDGVIGLDQWNVIRFISTKAETVLGWSSEQAVGRNVHELLCVGSRGFEHQLQQCPLCQEQTSPDAVTSCFWQRADGYSVSVDYRMFAVSVGVVRRVLTLQSNQGRTHSAQEAEKLLRYVENHPAPIAEFDIDGHIVFGNAAFHKALLQAGFDDVGQSRMLPCDIEQLCRDCARSQECCSSSEISCDGRWWSWHFAPIENAQNEAVIGYAFDMSERKRLELQSNEAKAHARQDFYAKMVHELRTPLNAIIGFSQVLARRLEGTVQARDLANIEAIKIAGLQLNQMINNTLETAKIEACKVEVETHEFSVHQVFAAVSEQLEGLAQAKGLDYRVQCDRTITIISDIDKVRQILVNLISNAIKYTHQGGVSVAVELKKAKGVVVFTVSDTGVGIAQEHLAGLFAAFGRVRTDNTHDVEGTGLGLALVAEFVEILKGSVSVSSALDKGTTFIVELPIAI